MKTISKSILAIGLLGLSVGANAALVNGSVLAIGAGSYWEVETDVGYFTATNMVGLNGIRLGTSQIASGDHIGTIDGTESPNIDYAFNFFGNTGMHSSVSPTNVLSASGNTATVDFSGWRALWNGIYGGIPINSGAWDGNPNGVAQVICGYNCELGDSYTLHYSATVPAGDPSGLGGIRYRLNMQGVVVPVPAAAWLLGSGLIGLMGLARRKKSA